MASIWLYLGIGIGSLLLGGIITFVFSALWNRIYDFFRITRHIPKDKKLVSEGLKLNKEFFANPGHEKIDIKEVEENARIGITRTREFEKLRRDAFLKGGDKETQQPDRGEGETDSFLSGIRSNEEGRELPSISFEDNSPVSGYPDTTIKDTEGTKRKVRFD